MISDVFLGPVCDYVIAPVARYSGVWKIPVMTAGAQAENFNYREEYPTLTRMMGSYKLVGEALRHILHVFGWNVAGLLYYNHGVNSLMGNSKCHFTLSAVYIALGRKPEYVSFNDTADNAVYKDLLNTLSNSARSECVSRNSSDRYRIIIYMVFTLEIVIFKNNVCIMRLISYRKHCEPFFSVSYSRANFHSALCGKNGK
jgi:atrial natriuretic peptide receptor A